MGIWTLDIQPLEYEGPRAIKWGDRMPALRFREEKDRFRGTLGQVENRRGPSRAAAELDFHRCQLSCRVSSYIKYQVLHITHIMAPSLPPGGQSFSYTTPFIRYLQLTSSPEARPSPKPQPIGSFPFLLLFTTATVCVLFIIWRRSERVRTVVVHQCVQRINTSIPFGLASFLD